MIADGRLICARRSERKRGRPVLIFTESVRACVNGSRVPGFVPPRERAAIALSVLPQLEAEARKRQAHGQTAPGKTLTQKIAEASEGEAGEAVERAAEMFHTNKQYIKDMKRIEAVNE